MKGPIAEVVALLAQCTLFVGGMVLSLIVGIALAARVHGPGSLLAVTVLAGAGLLAAAIASQALRDYLLRPPPKLG